MIRRLLYKFHQWVNSYGQNDVAAAPGLIAAASDEVSVDGLRFVVMPAIGGTLVQIRTYDKRSDRNNTSTYIITSDEDVSTRVGQIVSMELLKV